MLQNMIDAIDNEVIEDDVYLSLVSFVVNGNSIILTLELTYQDDENVLQKWEIQCNDFGEHKLELFYFSDFKVLDEHVYLWDYNKDYFELYFNGHVKDSKKIIGELYIAHRDITNNLIPFGTYMNGNIDWLLGFDLGLFAKAPVNLIKEYFNVLEDNGLKGTLLPTKSDKQWNGKQTDYKVLIFGDSYVVAKEFIAIQLDNS
ncbi:hypothetical protein HZF08_35495 [Paenibacillus sp. CGMCC 1.16610]|uniref:Uncharacterized protein n=1 Tax=Paenibacillus anseongense TaxID=2682845 RepID=A0ABW9TZ07_9BACL|nr:MULTISPECIES: hypothetical protein [Paenibacillus]MBA2943581.1 hypothetical protein [Paenibacillus sp. CGMCC 1.16610]MVQ33077.1 hypothetical protein [Paenibacillus anseongense]